MTRKHFEQIALILSNINDWDDRHQAVAEFCAMAVADNARFDATRFIMRVNELRGGE